MVVFPFRVAAQPLLLGFTPQPPECERKVGFHTFVLAGLHMGSLFVLVTKPGLEEKKKAARHGVDSRP